MRTETISIRTPFPPPAVAASETIEIQPAALPWRERAFLVIAALLGLRLLIRGRRWT